MKHRLSRGTHKSTGKIYNKKRFVVFAAVFALTGLVVMFAVRAATSTASFEAEAGIKSSPVIIVNDSTASAGQAIKFGVTVTTSGTTKFGMSAPQAKWDERLLQVGGDTNIHYRRIFYNSFEDNLSLVQTAINDGMIPVISWKTGLYSWAQVGSGQADAALRSLVTKLNAIPGRKHLVLHHEPAGDGTAKDYVALQVRGLTILKTAQQATVGPIANGWWWSSRSQGYTDAEIAQWLTPQVIALSDVIAADTYQDQTLEEDGSVKAKNMSLWAQRVGVTALGIGEFNGFNASAITNTMNVVKADIKFKWALVWNSGPTGLGTPLDGARLEAFKAGILTSGPTSVGL